MNEEQTVLNFFSAEENFSLALIAAEHLDNLRAQYNNRFWDVLNERVELFLQQNSLPWHCELTEDRNSDNTLVGLHLEPASTQRIFLRPFMEQQLMGTHYRIYYGLMWNTTPDPALKNLPEVLSLFNALEADGFKQNDSFLAWQWSPWHPRRKDFLMRLSQNQDDLLLEAMQPWLLLLDKHLDSFTQANSALGHTPPTAIVSLDKLRSNIK